MNKRSGQIQLVYKAALGFFLILGFLLFSMIVIESRNDRLALFAALPMLVTVFFLTILRKRHRYEVAFDPSQYGLDGAYQYELIYENSNDIIKAIKDLIIQDGFDRVGTIENPLDSVMEVYTEGKGYKNEMVFLIQADKFTMGILFEHLFLFYDFLRNHSLQSEKQWLKRMRTVIVVREMTLALQILLSALKIHVVDITGGHVPQIYALAIEKKKVYTKLVKSIFRDRHMQNFEKYLIAPSDQKPKLIWKQSDWSDLLLLEWVDWTYYGAQRYDTTSESTEVFENNLVSSLVNNGYEHVGDIGDELDVNIKVYIQDNKGKGSEEIVFVFEGVVFTKDVFHQHRYLIREHLKDHFKDPDYRWNNSTRIVIIVQEMSVPLQILQSMFSVYPSNRTAYVCAYVEQERKVYTMIDREDEFFDSHIPWVNEYLPETNQQEAEQMWRGLEWKTLDGLPFTKKEMIMTIHKALNLWEELSR